MVDEQGSQQSSSTVEQQLAGDDGLYGAFPTFAQVQLAAQKAQSQLRILGQQRKQEQLAKEQQRQVYRSQATVDDQHNRRSSRVRDMQMQQATAAHAAKGADSLERGWAAQQPRSPVPKRRSRYGTRSSSSPIAAAAKAAAAVLPTVVQKFQQLVQRISTGG